MQALQWAITAGWVTAATGCSGSPTCGAEPELLITADGVEFVRTPDACFDDLPSSC